MNDQRGGPGRRRGRPHATQNVLSKMMAGFGVAVLAASTSVLATAGPVSAQESGEWPVVGVVASADDGNVPENTIDKDLGTRWSAEGDGQWIRFDLGEVRPVDTVAVAWFSGDARSSLFDVETSLDAKSWTHVFSGQSSGITLALQPHEFTEQSARFVRITGHGNTSNAWNSITEVEIFGPGGPDGAPPPWPPPPPPPPPPPTAAEYFDRVMADPGLHTGDYGEQWAWVVNFHVHGFTQGYEAYGDTAWLDYAVEFYDFALSKLQEAPDGYLGWIGSYIYDGSLWADVHVGDVLVFNPMLEFAQIVLADEELAEIYGADASRYVELAEKHLIEKWDARGTYHVDGPYGFYDYWNHFFSPGDLSEFVVRDDAPSANTSQQFNKQTQMGVAALRLARLTGKDEYLDRAEQIFTMHKAHFQLYGDAYVWNFRDPLAPYDVRDVETGDLETWVAVHPSRSGYQNSEVADAVEAYNAGVVYTERDIRRFINTNVQVMWNGDVDDPAYTGPDAEILPEGATPAVGTLWTALVQFDPVVRQLRERQLEGVSDSDLRGRIARDLYLNVDSQSPPSFERTDPGEPLRLFEFPHAEVRGLNMAGVLPSRIMPGVGAVVAVKSIVAGQVRTSLYSADGQTEVMVLDERFVTGGPDGRVGVSTFVWDGTDGRGEPLPAGEYRVRWSLAGDGYREFPVTVLASCDMSVTGVHVGPLTVRSGVVCVAEGARVVGPVTVRAGAGLVVTSAAVTGPVVSDDAAVVTVVDTRIVGPVTITGTTSQVRFSGNRVTGPVFLTGNRTPDGSPVLSGNTITGSLSCSDNHPGPVHDGATNHITGPKTGQCANL